MDDLSSESDQRYQIIFKLDVLVISCLTVKFFIKWQNNLLQMYHQYRDMVVKCPHDICQLLLTIIIKRESSALTKSYLEIKLRDSNDVLYKVLFCQ